MKQNASPYDQGSKLEPKPWVKDGIAGIEEPRPAENADYGRVDFDNEEGATELTVWAVPTEDGIVLRVQSVGDTPITIETEGDRTARQSQLTYLHDELAALGEEAQEYLSWDDEGDPSAFAPGNFELASVEPEGDEFYVELTYTGTNPYEDEEAIPTGITWHTRSRDYDGHGSYRTLSSPHYTAPISEAQTAVNAAKQWAAGVAEKHATAVQYPHQASPQIAAATPSSGPRLS